MIRYSFLNHVAEIMALAPGIVLLYMVNLQFPPQVAGAFGAAWVIVGTSVLLVPVAAATSLFVEGSHSREALGTDLRRTVRLTLPLLGAATLGLFFLGRPVLGLFGEGYAEGGAGVLQLLALSGAFFTVNTLYTAVKRVEKRMDAVVAVVTYTAAVTVGLTAYLLPAHGIVAAGYAFMVAHGTMSLAIGLAYVGRRLAGSRTARVGSGALGNGRR
jgi:O-antigen/teichoic acid export membrane protein